MSDSKIMSDSHWLGRIKDLMQQVGMPDSQSLYLAFTQLMFDMQRAALAAAPEAPRAALPEFIRRKAEEAIEDATNPKGMRTNGPAYARIEASHLAALLRCALPKEKA